MGQIKIEEAKIIAPLYEAWQELGEKQETAETENSLKGTKNIL